MQIPDQELVKVQSLSEIKTGITVVTKTCLVCDKVHAFMVIGIVRDWFGEKAVVEPQWRHSPHVTMETHMNAGRLFRLRDLDFRQEARREMECDKDDARRKERKNSRVAIIGEGIGDPPPNE